MPLFSGGARTPGVRRRPPPRDRERAGRRRERAAHKYHFTHARGRRIAMSARESWADSWPGFFRLLKGQRCRFVVHDANDLALFHEDTFDLIYTSLVLQHMRPEYSLNYIKEFLRVLAPGGLIIFQIPSRRLPEREVRYT